MSNIPNNHARHDATTLLLRQARSRFDAWLEQRSADDDKNFHQSQLEAIKQLLGGVLIQFGDRFSRLALDQPPAAVLADCRVYDTALGRFYRAWQIVRERFDQRDGDEERNQLLKAADEVAWSCYSPVMLQASFSQLAITMAPPPLVCLDTLWAPEISRRQDLPSIEQIGAATTEDLGAFLGRLPITLIRLPPWAVEMPWQLIFVAHEVGHLIYNQLGRGSWLREQLATAAEDAGEPGLASKWRGYSEEIFADLFSVMIMGEWALWGLVELVARPNEQLAESLSSAYPPTAVRLELMAHAARQLGRDTAGALRGLDLQAAYAASPIAAKHRKVVEPALQLLQSDLGGGLGTLRDLCEADALSGPAHSSAMEQETQIAEALLQGTPPQLVPSVHAARPIMRGAVSAWASLQSERDATKRAAASTALASALVATLNRSAPQGRRGESDEVSFESIATAFADLLLQDYPVSKV